MRSSTDRVTSDGDRILAELQPPAAAALTAAILVGLGVQPDCNRIPTRSRTDFDVIVAAIQLDSAYNPSAIRRDYGRSSTRFRS